MPLDLTPEIVSTDAFDDNVTMTIAFDPVTNSVVFMITDVEEEIGMMFTVQGQEFRRIAGVIDRLGTSVI